MIRHAGVLFPEAPGRKPSVVMVNDTLTTPRLGYSRYLTWRASLGLVPRCHADDRAWSVRQGLGALQSP